MRLPVADEQPQVHQRLALVEMRWRVGGLRRVDLDHLEPCVHQVVGDQVVTAVGATFEARGQHRVRLEQKVEGVCQCVDVDGTLEVRGEADEVVRLSEHFLTERQLANDRRWKHVYLSSVGLRQVNEFHFVAAGVHFVCGERFPDQLQQVSENPLGKRLHGGPVDPPAVVPPVQVQHTGGTEDPQLYSVAQARNRFAHRQCGVGVESDRDILAQRRQIGDRADVGEEDVGRSRQRRAAARSGAYR